MTAAAPGAQPVVVVEPRGGKLDVHVDAGPWFANASLWVSLVALVVSVLTAFSTSRRDRKARTRSIQDDFWLRKVVSPISIEGVSEAVFDQLDTLPLSTCPMAEREAFHRDFKRSIQDCGHKLQFLGLMQPSLAEFALLRFEQFEDDVAKYLFYEEMDEPERGAALTARVVRQNATSMLLEIMAKVRNYQETAW